MGKSIRNLAAVTRVRLDLAKRVFRVRAVEAKGEIVMARRLTHQPAPSRFSPSCHVRGGDGGVLLGASLGAGADRTRARGSIAAARPCEALC